MTKNDGEVLALEILAWIAKDKDVMVRFSNFAGIAPIDLMAHAGEPEMLGGMLDFFLLDEALLCAFCEETGTNKQAPIMARQLLPGADVPYST